MKHIFFSSFCFIVLLLYGACFAEEPEDTTTYTVKGIITNYKPNATLYFAMYSSQKDFDEQNFYRKLRHLKDQLPKDTIRFEFTGVKKGHYIIAGYQDIDGNGKIKMGWFGPKEPFYIYQPNYGIFAPKFSKCKFLVDQDIDTIKIIFK